MNRHLTMDELLALRSGEGAGPVRAHLEACAACASEYERLSQRMAALRALPARRPPRDRWPAIKARVVAERRRKLMWRGLMASTAVAASFAIAVGLRPEAAVVDRPIATESRASIEALQTQSRQLESLLAAYGTEGRVMDGRTAAIVANLEDRIALVDAGLMQARRVNAPVTDVADLWRGRVELMDALVNAHVARASYVGF